MFVLVSVFPEIPGDMELKKNKSLPADEQIVTANPDLNMVYVELALVHHVPNLPVLVNSGLLEDWKWCYHLLLAYALCSNIISIFSPLYKYSE